MWNYNLGVEDLSKALSDVFISIALAIILLVFGVQLPRIPQGAKTYPVALLIISALLVIMSLVMNIKKYKEQGNKSEENENSGQLKIIIIYMVFIGVYIFIMDKIGYSLSTYLFTLLSLLFLKVQSKKVLIILPVGITLVIYFVFTNLLAVMLPRGSWLPF